VNLADRLSKQSPRLQRVVALLVIPGAVLALGAAALWPMWYAYAAQMQWREEAARTLAHQRGLAAIEDEVRLQWDAVPNLRGWERLYRTATPGAATIALQSDLSAALTAAHAQVQTLTPLAPAQTGALQKIGLHVVATMKIDEFGELLRQMSQLSRFVRFEQLLVNAPAGQLPNENPTLVVSMDVVGFAIDTRAQAGAAHASNEDI
jgi:Type II secretion system (T2SS), protein M subtype b